MAAEINAIDPTTALASLWLSLSMPADALSRAGLSGTEPVLPSSFAVATALQASLAAAALAASEVGRCRGGVVQDVAVDMADAAAEATLFFRLDGRKPEIWDPLAGLYRCSDGWIRLHTNFAHHRDGVLRLLGLAPGPQTKRAEVEAALAARSAQAFEAEASAAGLVVAAVRTAVEWHAHPQHAADLAAPLIDVARIGDAAPLAWPPLSDGAAPLGGLRVLDLTRILAGPIGTRTLAAYGADVMLVNSPKLPNIEAIAVTSRGKHSALADLHDPAMRAAFAAMVGQAHVLVQGYRPGAMASLGFGADEAARLRPGIVYVSLSAYSAGGPWHARRGFDSLVQTATGLNDDEAVAAGADAPKALPVQVLDLATGFLIAFAVEAALLRQRHEGGSWHVRLSLARTALWLRSLGRLAGGFAAARLDVASRVETELSGFGTLLTVRHAARFGGVLVRFARPAMPPGSDPLRWP
ncbi:MAG: CoA transferase [Caldimonas sp.]